MKTGSNFANDLVRSSWVFLAGCVLLMLPSYVSQPAEPGGSAAIRGMVRIEPLRDARRDAVGTLIGERTTIGNISMGSIEMNPAPTAMMAKVLQAELARMGFSVVDSGEQFRIGAQLARFQITTPATALYWDINGAIELDLAATGQGGSKHDARYVAQCTNRTYAWPSEELIGGVVSACLKDIGSKIRSDAALSSFLSAR
jgi:uncharacterized lipoprotein YajG